MSIRKVSFIEGEYYHIYNRGNSKQAIFHDTQDYSHFIALLHLLNTEENQNVSHLKRSSGFDPYVVDNNSFLVSVGAYCLMPNHFHILLTEKTEGGISKFMQKISTAYVMYYNKKYDRTGSLFEGKFKSQHVESDRYLKYMFAYIHLNPIKLLDAQWKVKGIRNKKRTLAYLEKYTYSSYLDFLGEKRPQRAILNLKDFPNYFPNKKAFISEIFSWLRPNALGKT